MGSSLLSIGARAMFANYAALQTTGNNIANANTPGYSRQQVELSTAGGQFTGAGFFGKGVNIDTITRAHNAFLTKEAALSRSQAAADETRLQQLQELEKVFPTGEGGLGFAAGEMLNAFVEVANNPQDPSARQVVLARAEDLALRFRAAGDQVNELQVGTNADIRNAVSQVNALAKQVATINQQIAQAKGLGHTPNDLLDQRDQLVSEINQYMQVTTIEADDGTLGLFIGGGQRLVLSNQALELVVQPGEYDQTQSRISIREAGGDRAVPPSVLAGGTIAGLLRFQNDLSDARNLLGQMAAAFSARVNEQQSFGLDLRQPAGAGVPLFSTGAPRVLANVNNASAAVPVSLAIADASQLQASDYELRGDPATPGGYILTRLSDGLARQVNSGDTVDGFTINVGAPAPGPNDRFLLQPVAMAGQDMQRVLDDPKGLAAASPVISTVGPNNTGSATVASLAVVSSTVNPALTANISFTSNTGAYAWELRDASNAVVSSGTGTWTANQPIALNGFELRLNGVPRTGDTFSVRQTQFPATNNGNAVALMNLRDEAMVGVQVLGGGAVVPGETITSAYAQAMAGIGTRVQSAKAASSISSAVAENAEAMRAGQAGVNLDEEAARLIQFQQSYQAAAKVLQVAQTVFDTLLDMAR
jgi:flagellar hook-associated protein 1 FlgK